MKKYYVLIAALFSCFTASSAHAIADYEMSWTGDGGYSMEGLFSFDETTAPAVISELGSGPTSDIISITATFFDPSSTPIISVTPVIAGVSNYFFLQFNFDTITETFLPTFDVGIDTGNIGDTYLYWVPVASNDVTLAQLDNPFQPTTLDSGGTITASRVAQAPEPTTLALFGIGLAGLGFARKKKKSV